MSKLSGKNIGAINPVRLLLLTMYKNSRLKTSYIYIYIYIYIKRKHEVLKVNT